MIKILLLLFSMSVLANEGVEVGNGGGVITCLFNDEIKTAKVLDLYLGERDYGMKIVYSPAKADLQISQVVKKLGSIDAEFQARFVEEFEKMKDIFEFVIDIEELPFTWDFAWFPYPEVNYCNSSLYESKFRQAALYAEDESYLLLDSLVWIKLDETNKAGLLVHEVIYAMLRKHRNHRTSMVVQKMVAYLFSDKQPREYRSYFETYW